MESFIRIKMHFEQLFALFLLNDTGIFVILQTLLNISRDLSYANVFGQNLQKNANVLG